MPHSMRGFVGCVRRCWLQVIDNEQFGDSGVICAASATVEDCGSGSVKGDTRTHTLACANTCPWQEHACTHTSSCTCTRARTRKNTYAAEHIARTRSSRTRTGETPGSTYTRHSTIETGNPHRTPPPCLAFLIYHRRLQMLSRVGGTCALVSMALPPRVWPTVHLRHATLTGREMRESENRLRNARRACICCPESDASS